MDEICAIPEEGGAGGDARPVGSRHLTGSDPVSALGVGDQAPDFELRRTFEETVRLDELIEHRPALLVFYVFDFGHV